MYQYQLNVIFFGFDKSVVDIFSKITPLPKFTHNILALKKIGDIKKKIDAPNTIAIIKDEEELTKKTAREKFSEKVKIILVTDGQSEKNELDIYEDIWTNPILPSVLKFKFLKLLERIKFEKDAWFESQYLEVLLNTVPDLVWIKNIDGCHLNVNEAFCEAVGKERSDVRGKYHEYIWGSAGKKDEEGEKVCRESEMAVVKAGNTLHSDECVRHKHRGMCELSVLKSPIFGEDGKSILGTLGFARDITKEKEAQEKILQLAHTDALTGLYNRRYFYQCIEDNRKNQGLTICYIDLDHFKQLNDTYGHNAGDGAILGVAELLRLVFHKDLITRMGGDEFAVGIIGERTKKEMDDHITYLENKGREMFLSEVSMKDMSMSIGISSVASQKTLEALLLEGDNALYYSKEHGRAQHTFYDDIAK